MAAGVLQSAEFISSHSKHVRVCDEGIKRGAQLLIDNWNKELTSDKKPKLEPPGLTETETLEWIFLIDTLNFCFWSDAELFTVEVDGTKYDGYFSLLACLKRAVQEGIKIYDPSVYGSITLEQFKHVFRSSNNTEIPLIEERLSSLHEASSVLNQKFEGSVVELVTRAQKSAQRLVELLVDNFSSYQDTAVYQGRKVHFYKRAQIFASDVWSHFKGKGYGRFHDIKTLTMFPDYRVPQILLHVGALKYSGELLQKLKNREHLPAGIEEECEIRGCSVWAIELIRRELSTNVMSGLSLERRKELKSCEIDYFFWKWAKAHNCHCHPIHRTLTIFY